MCDTVIPPSPNWYLGNVISCSEDGKTLAYGARHELVVIKLSLDGTKKQQAHVELPVFIPVAHKDKVTCVVFPPSGNKDLCRDHIASCSEDGSVMIWNYQMQKLIYFHNGHPEGHKVVGLDWSKADPNLIVSVSDLGSIVCWNLSSNTIKRLFAGSKVCPLTVACNPHNKDIIAIGAKAGLVVIYSVKGDGDVIFRLRGHETDVISLAFCPVPENIFQPDSESKVHLLATGSKDKVLYFWKTATDGRYETSINLPSQSLSGGYRKNGVLQPSNCSWVCVRWPSKKTLLLGSLQGELLQYNLDELAASTNSRAVSSDGNKKKNSVKPTLVHGCHMRGLFSVAVASSPLDSDSSLVWTYALDKRIICSTFGKNPKVIHNVATIGGIVYCFAVSPVDPNRLAFGTGDNKLSVWNMSSSTNEILYFWNKVNSKVMAISWHPKYENLLAFGTGEGRIGLLDVSSSKPPTLLRLFHRRSIYSLVWAPLIICDESNKGKIGLFSVGDGEILQYDTSLPDKDPESLNPLMKLCDKESSIFKNLMRTDISWNHNRSLAAIGNENGCIYIVDGSELKYIHSVFAHKRLVQCLCWHPGTVTSESSESMYSSWIASASDDVQIISVTDSGVSTVASFSEHAERIVSLMWSPHINGRLVTASYDYTSQVWDVISGTMLARFDLHHGMVLCCLFSPSHPDKVLTGSADFTLRLWDINNFRDNTKTASKNKKQRINCAAKKLEGAIEATDLNAPDGREYDNCNDDGVTIKAAVPITKSESKGSKKSKSLFPISNPSLSQAKHLELLWKRINLRKTQRDSSSTEQIATDKEDSVQDMSTDSIASDLALTEYPQSVESPSKPSITETCYLDFFGDDKDMSRLLLVEEDHHSKGNLNHATHISLWSGRIKEVIEEAAKKKQLNDWLVSLSPLVSHATWVKCCTSYAAQLMESGDGLKAVSYLLSVHKVEEAVDSLIEAKLPKEAVALAKSRFSMDDPIVHRAMKAWSALCLSTGQLVLASHCLLSIGANVEALEILSKSKDASTLSLGARIAACSGCSDLAVTLALRSVAVCLANHDFASAVEVLTHYPTLKDTCLWVQLCELVKEWPLITEEDALKWLSNDGSDVKSSISMRETDLYSACIKLAGRDGGVTPDHYQSLERSIPINPDHSSHKTVWMYICGQLTLSAMSYWLEDGKEDAAKHLIRALNAATSHQVLYPFNNDVLLQLCVWLTPSGSCSKFHYFNDIGLGFCQSIDSHLAAGSIYWMEYILTKESNKIPGDTISLVVKHAIESVLVREAISHYRRKPLIKRLQSDIATARLKSSSPKAPGNGSLSPTESNRPEELLLNQLKTEETRFIHEVIALPNPFVLYNCIGTILDLIGADVKAQVNDTVALLNAHWKNLTKEDIDKTNVACGQVTEIEENSKILSEGKVNANGL